MKERTSMENLLEVSDDRKKQSKQKFWKAQIEIVIGAFLYTVPYNLIITPMGLYNGYMTGIAQIIKTILVSAGNSSIIRLDRNYFTGAEYPFVSDGISFDRETVFSGDGIYSPVTDGFLFGDPGKGSASDTG